MNISEVVEAKENGAKPAGMGDIPTGFAVGECRRILLEELTRRGLEPHQNIYCTRPGKVICNIWSLG